MAKKGNRHQESKPKTDISIEKTVEELKVHIVQHGDTLHNLAATYLGSMSRANEIKRLNNLHNDFLFIGNELKIPNK